MRAFFWAPILALVFTSQAGATEPVFSSSLVSESRIQDWQGPYVGIGLGQASGSTRWSDPVGFFANPTSLAKLPVSSDGRGILLGLRGGWNLQNGPWVMGIEADWSVADIHGDAVCGGLYGSTNNAANFGWRCKNKLRVLDTAGVRLGYAIGPALIFAKFGGAHAITYERVSYYKSSSNRSRSSQNMGRFGWMAGIGADVAFDDHWSARIGYDHISFPSASMAIEDAFGTLSFSGARTQHNIGVWQFGLNYHFWSAPGAKINAQPVFNDIDGEIGTRIGWSDGLYDWKLYTSSSRMISRIIWNGLNGYAPEAFARINHASGLFVKGLAGGISLQRGRQTDEDWSLRADNGTLVPYSRTYSQSRDSNLTYFTIDGGLDVWTGQAGRIGLFTGVTRYNETLRGYGCIQEVVNGYFCGTISLAQPTFTVEQKWSAMRLGVHAAALLTDELSATFEAAWLPITYAGVVDHHWLRPDINPLKAGAHGRTGYQLEALINWRATERIDIGLGARYWLLDAKGTTKFPTFNPQPVHHTSRREMIFVQTSYRFGEIRGSNGP